MSTELVGKKDVFEPRHYLDFHIDQIQAANYTLAVIDKLQSQGKLNDSLKAVQETDVFRLRRGLCLPSAGAACINWINKKRTIGDSQGEIKIGDIFAIFSPFHGQKEFASDPSLNLSRGWLFCTEQGDLYHHVMVAFAKSLDISSISVVGFKDVRDLLPILSDRGAIGISLNNRFVPEKTLRNNPELVSEIDGKKHLLIEGRDGESYRKFEDGRHVVAILDQLPDGDLVVLDSYRLPQMQLEDAIVKISPDEINKYIEDEKIGVSRALLFAGDENLLSRWQGIASNVFVPKELIEASRNYIDSLKLS